MKIETRGLGEFILDTILVTLVNLVSFGFALVVILVQSLFALSCCTLLARPFLLALLK